LQEKREWQPISIEILRYYLFYYYTNVSQLTSLSLSIEILRYYLFYYYTNVSQLTSLSL